MTIASILNFSTAFPALRLSHEALVAAWGSGAGRGLKRKPFCSYDEDVISLAIAAARGALSGFGEIGALYVGSTSLPYEEKPASATIVTAAIGSSAVRTVEVRGSCQAGLQALILAGEYVRSHPQSLALAIATDAPSASPSTTLDNFFSAGAAAFLVGAKEGIASLETDASVTVETFGSRFRRFGERFIGDLELRTAEQTKEIAALKGVLNAGDVKTLALGASANLSKSFVRAFGGAPDDLWPMLGDAGSANAPIALARALETAAAGDVILAVALGGGATAVSVKRTAKPLETRSDVMARLTAGSEVDYLSYLKHRRLIGAKEHASA